MMADIEFLDSQAGAGSPAEFDPDIQIIDRQAPAPHGRPCESCGSPVEPLDKFCPACGAPQEAAAGEGAPAGPAPPAPAEAQAKKYLRCENCGAEVAMDAQQRSYVCPFCDSAYVVEFSPQETGRQAPEFIIGFAVTPEEAQEKFRQWIRSNGLFRPGDLHLAQIEEKLKGVYLPF